MKWIYVQRAYSRATWATLLQQVSMSWDYTTCLVFSFTTFFLWVVVIVIICNSVTNLLKNTSPYKSLEAVEFGLPLSHLLTPILSVDLGFKFVSICSSTWSNAQPHNSLCIHFFFLLRWVHVCLCIKQWIPLSLVSRDKETKY